jgi:hypothetical protein
MEGNRMGPTTVFSLCLLVISALLIWTHVRTWTAIRVSDADESERRFGLGQLRRRVTASSLIGLIGVALLVNARMMDPTRVSFWLYWVGILLGLMTIGLLAMLDLVSTRIHYRQLRDSSLIEQAILKAQLHRLQAHRRNGDHR